MCKRIVLDLPSLVVSLKGTTKAPGFTAHLPTKYRTLTAIRVTTGGFTIR